MKPYFTNRNLYLFGLFVTAVGLPLSHFLMSVGQFILLGNWIIEGDWRRKWQVIKTSRVLWVLSAFYLLHLLGLLWTSDYEFATNDLKIKLPLFWFPLLFITSRPIKFKEIQGLLWFFTAAVFIATIVCTLVWLGYTRHKIVDIRDISIFNSHIRFALMIDLAICFLLHKYFKSGKPWLFILKLVLIGWLVIFMGIMQSLTGFAILGVLLIYYLYLFVRELYWRKWQLIFTLVLVAIVFAGIIFVNREIKNVEVPIINSTKLYKTRNGCLYFHDTTNVEAENGNLVWTNICKTELLQEWKKKSRLNLDGKDKKGNQLILTLVRYMASKGLNKDSMGVWQLSQDDVGNIERGTPNYLYTNKSGLETKLYEILNEYDAYKRGQNPTGHSILMRLEFWRVGFDIIKRKWLIGVGTGDVQRAYYNQYIYSGSKLRPEWQKRSHNQFMATTIGLGILGLLSFILYLFFPIFKIREKHYLFTTFFIISILSMLNEDTLENQAGVTFYGFFYGLLCLRQCAKNMQKTEK